MSATTPRVRVVLGFNQTKVPVVLVRSKNIYNGLSSNPSIFVTPVITLAALLAAINALDTAQQASTGTRAKGAATTRNLKLAALWTMLEQIVKYVQSLCDAVTSEQALSIIQAAGLEAAKATGHVKDLLAVDPGTDAGAIDCEAYAKLLKQGRGKARSTFFNWRVTCDGGKTYVSQTTPGVKATFTGLPSGTTASVEVSITDSQGTIPWSQAVTCKVP